MNPKKIAVIGNSCSGKTQLSRALASIYNLPVVHVDSIQFLPGMKLRDPAETRKILEEKSNGDAWIIDGFGPLKIIEDRFQKADVIVFIRFPLWRTYWWCFKRQLKGIFVRRPELPEGCFESTISQTLKLVRTIWNVHFGMWPQLDRIFLKEKYINKIVYVRAIRDFKIQLRSGIESGS